MTNVVQLSWRKRTRLSAVFVVVAIPELGVVELNAHQTAKRGAYAGVNEVTLRDAGHVQIDVLDVPIDVK